MQSVERDAFGLFDQSVLVGVGGNFINLCFRDREGEFAYRIADGPDDHATSTVTVDGGSLGSIGGMAVDPSIGEDTGLRRTSRPISNASTRKAYPNWNVVGPVACNDKDGRRGFGTG